MTLGLCLEAFGVPVKELLNALVNFNFVGPTQTVELVHVNELTRGTVGLACVKVNLALEADSFHHEFAEFADGEFLAGAHVYVAVADFAEARYSAATASTVVTVHSTVHACAIMHARVLFDADDVAEVHVQEHMHRGIGHIFAPKKLAERLTGTPECHLVVLDAVLGQDLQNFILGSVAVNSFDRALVHVDLDASPVAIVDELGQVHFAHHGGHHVAVFQVEVVVGAVEVRGHHSDVVGAVLQVVALAHLEARNLRDGVFLVGVFEFAREEGVLLHGLRSIFRINAGRAEEQELLHVVRVGFAEHIALNLHVHHHEVRSIERICHNTAHESSGEHHGIGLFFVKKLLDGILIGKVEFLVSAANKIVVASGFQIIPDGGAHQPMVARNVDFCVLV